MKVQRALYASILLLSPGSFGCDPPAPPPPTPPADGPKASTVAPTESAAPPPAPAAPDDLDVPGLQKALRCSAAEKTGACGVLTAIAAPCAPWDAVVPSGDGRWMGRGHLVQQGKSAPQLTLVRALRLPLTEVGPGQLPVKIGVAELTRDEPSYGQALRAIRAFELGDVPARGNTGVEFVKQRAEWSDAFATKTVGGQVFALSQGGTFLCQGAKRQLLFVQRDGSRTDKGDGIYAELWPATW